MSATLRYVLLTALRDRLFATLLGLGALVYLVCGFLGDAALAEGNALSVSLASGAGRSLLVAGILVFTAFHVRRMAENRELETLLARPISRTGFVMAYGAGLSAVAVLLALPLGLGLAFFSPDWTGLALWALSLAFEAVIVAALGLFAALALETAVAAVLTAGGIYILARLMSVFVSIAESRLVASETQSSVLDLVVRLLLQALSLILPRLDLYAQSVWLVHGAPPAATLLFILVQTAVYLPLLLLACVFDLRRKRF
jgi:ABC-type transport system involved in multi-copper enzyme maturation permease subunit